MFVWVSKLNSQTGPHLSQRAFQSALSVLESLFCALFVESESREREFSHKLPILGAKNVQFHRANKHVGSGCATVTLELHQSFVIVEQLQLRTIFQAEQLPS
ncbi:MAG: hypothetical protein P8Z33_14225, partial [Gammaproteobacteria bacterium]